MELKKDIVKLLNDMKKIQNSVIIQSPLTLFRKEDRTMAGIIEIDNIEKPIPVRDLDGFLKLYELFQDGEMKIDEDRIVFSKEGYTQQYQLTLIDNFFKIEIDPQGFLDEIKSNDNNVITTFKLSKHDISLFNRMTKISHPNRVFLKGVDKLILTAYETDFSEQSKINTITIDLDSTQIKENFEIKLSLDSIGILPENDYDAEVLKISEDKYIVKLKNDILKFVL